MNPCRDFFCAHLNDSNKVDALIQETDRIAWEGISASEHSPEPVANGEVLCRQLVQPIHFQEDGSINPTAFDDVMNKGLSTDRLKHRDIAESWSEGVERAERHNADFPLKPRRELVALAKFHVAEVRSITSMNTNDRAVAVYDTALQANPAHADVCVVVEKTKENKRSIRSKLYDVAKRYDFNP
jgi:hypothetical protein